MCRTLQDLKASHDATTSSLQSTAAKQASEGAGESDLRRLRRQFSSLKNTYMLYETKEQFITGQPRGYALELGHTICSIDAVHASCWCSGAGLLAGLPDGSENEKLQILEEEVENQGLRVKQRKQGNAKVCQRRVELLFDRDIHQMDQ